MWHIWQMRFKLRIDFNNDHCKLHPRPDLRACPSMARTMRRRWACHGRARVLNGTKQKERQAEPFSRRSCVRERRMAITGWVRHGMGWRGSSSLSSKTQTTHLSTLSQNSLCGILFCSKNLPAYTTYTSDRDVDAGLAQPLCTSLPLKNTTSPAVPGLNVQLG